MRSMEFPHRTYCFVPWKRMCETLVLIVLGAMAVEVAGDKKKSCPVSTETLYAFADSKPYRFYYTFKPLIQTNIDLIDDFLTSDKEVICEWVVRAKSDHTAAVKIEHFQLTPSSGSKHADCLKIYDGKTTDSSKLGELCGGDMAEDETRTFRATGQHLLLVYIQGEVTGHRGFHISYIAVASTKEMILKIAGIVSGSVAAVAIIVLTLKFTRGCRPCRKRCCPNQEMERGTTQQELYPLSPIATTLVPPSVGSQHGRGTDVSGGAAASTTASTAASEYRNPAQTPQEGREEEEECAMPADEPPPSYDSIFGNEEDRNKAN